MDDAEENAAIVNAIQRRAAVVVQKSLAEGFGLTVTEAMWKGRPLVVSRVGGIQDQIVDGVDGLTVDPRDLAGVRRRGRPPARRRRARRPPRRGGAARRRGPTSSSRATCAQWVDILARLVEAGEAAAVSRRV